LNATDAVLVCISGSSFLARPANAGESQIGSKTDDTTSTIICQEAKIMKTLLQSLRTGKFVRGHAKWTKAPEKARKFGSGAEAVFYSCRHALTNMQVVLEFADARKNLAIPLGEERVG